MCSGTGEKPLLDLWYVGLAGWAYAGREWTEPSVEGIYVTCTVLCPVSAIVTAHCGCAYGRKSPFDYLDHLLLANDILGTEPPIFGGTK